MMSIIKKLAAILIIITSVYFLFGNILDLPRNFEYLVGGIDRFDVIQIYNAFGWTIFRPVSYFSFIILGVVLLFEKK